MRETTTGRTGLEVAGAFESPSMARTMIDDIGVSLARAEGCHVWDEDGRRYIDLTSGSGVHVAGHRHPAVSAAMRAQLDTLTHAGWQYTCPARARLTEALAATLPWPDPGMLYCTTGSEAVEAALKVARAATGRREVIGFLGGYHGKTTGALGVTAQAAFRAGVTTLPLAALSLPYPVAPGYVAHRADLRGGHRFGQEILEHHDFGLSDVAAIVVEVVQGSGGMQAAAPGLLAELRRFTARHGILLIVDEIFTGLGRTGEMYGFQHERVVPDLVVIGKALGGGLPVSLVAGPRAVLGAIPPLRQTSTFSANPVACAAGTAVLDVIRDEDLARRAVDTGELLVRHLEQIREPGVRLAVSGRGLMVAAHVVEAPAPDRAAFTRKVVATLRDEGVLALRGGSDGAAVKFTPPLTIGDDLIEQSVEALARSVRAVAAGRRAPAPTATAGHGVP